MLENAYDTDSDTDENKYTEFPDPTENENDPPAFSTSENLVSEPDFEPEIIVEASAEKEVLRKLNTRILTLLSQEEGQTLLGLLPIDELEQEELISALRNEASGITSVCVAISNCSLEPRLMHALIVSKWYEGGSCWPIFEREEGIAVPVLSSAQGSFTSRFKYVCKRTLHMHLAEEGESGSRVDALFGSGCNR